MQTITKESVIVGVDVHKYTHEAVAIDCLGKELDKSGFSNDQLDDCVAWLSKLAPKNQLIVGLEDINGYGSHLAGRLLEAGFTVCYVPAVLTDRSRKRSIHKDKTDYLDAKRVGKVILHNSEETLPADDIIPDACEAVRTIDLLVQERGQLVKEQTKLKNQLHVLLHQYYGNSYRQGFKNIFAKKAISWYEARLQQDIAEHKGGAERSTKVYLAQSIMRRMKRLVMVQGQIKEITKALNRESRNVPEIGTLAENLRGCGQVTACKIMAEIGTIRRFGTRDKLAKYAGIAPVESSSGNKKRVYTNKGGNRKLNNAIHTIAISQIGVCGVEEAKEYYQKKLSEGKSKLWAIRCLKRQLINQVFAILSEGK